LILAATAIGGGVALGRRALDRAVERRLNDAIEIAQTNASTELDLRIRDLVRERLTALALTLAIKSALIAAAYALLSTGHLTPTGFRIVTAALIVGYLVRDLLQTAPYIAPAIKYVREARWSPRRALKTFVVGVVFERAYAEALFATERGANRFWVAMSNYRRGNLSEEVAQKIADVAVDTSFARARLLLIIAAAQAAAMLAAYAAFATLAIMSA
jgi:hypothetical protein